MRAFLATVLSLIATGVMLIAYGLLTPRVATADAYPSARPMLANERVGFIEDGYAPLNNRYASYTSSQQAMGYPVSAVRSVPAYDPYPAPVRRVATPVRRTTVARVERSSGRDWQKTAMVIGGSTAAGAGLGAIFGGKKGALIGAAIGGGASALYEVNHR
jgi:hypothetical protein